MLASAACHFALATAYASFAWPSHWSRLAFSWLSRVWVVCCNWAKMRAKSASPCASEPNTARVYSLIVSSFPFVETQGGGRQRLIWLATRLADDVSTCSFASYRDRVVVSLG